VGIFGNSNPYATTQSPLLPPDQVEQAGGPAPSMALQTQAPAPAYNPTGSGWFGGGITKDRLALLFAGMADAVDPLTMHPTGGGSLQALQQQQALLQTQKARRDAFNAAFDPTTGKFNGKKFISALAGGGVTPSEQDVKDYLTPQKPIDIGGAGYAPDDSGEYKQVIPKAPKDKPDYNIPGIGRFNGETNQPIVLEPGVTPTQAAAQAAQAPTASVAPGPKGQVYDQIAQAAAKNGAQPDETPYLQRLASVESSGNPRAKNGSSTGLYQFHPDSFAAAGGGNINDVGDQTKAALVTSRQYRQTLQNANLPPTDANTYILHQQGPAGGMALLQASQSLLDRTKNAISVLTPIYGGDVAKATQAIANNGGRLATTAGEFVDMWQKRWGGPQAAAGSPAPTVGAESAAAAPGGPMTFTKASGHPSTPAELASVGLPKGIPAWTGLDGKPVPYPASETGFGQGDDAPLSKDAIDFQASRYLKDGVLPPLVGKFGTQDKRNILNRATQVAKELNLSPEDFIAGTVGVKAAAAALSKATSLRSQIEGNAEAAMSNFKLALSMAPQGGGQTNSPVINRFTQYVRKQYAGDPQVAAFDNVLGSTADEFAKVMTGSSGGAPLSDSARNEAYKRLSGASSLAQLQSIGAAMEKEMANVREAKRNVEEGLRAQIRNGGANAAPAAPPTAAAPGGWGKAVVVKP
jgi:hypothetical protein